MAQDFLADRVVLVTGGTGSFGRRFAEIALARHKPSKLIILSRDELKQFEMREALGDHPALRSLPCFPAMEDEDVRRVVTVLAEAVDAAARSTDTQHVDPRR